MFHMSRICQEHDNSWIVQVAGTEWSLNGRKHTEELLSSITKHATSRRYQNLTCFHNPYPLYIQAFQYLIFMSIIVYEPGSYLHNWTRNKSGTVQEIQKNSVQMSQNTKKPITSHNITVAVDIISNQFVTLCVRNYPPNDLLKVK